MAMASRNAAAQSMALVSAARRNLGRRPPRPCCRAAPVSRRRQLHSTNDHIRNLNPSRRHKSSVPCPSPGSAGEHLDAVHERASRNALAFDSQHRLSEKDTLFSSWRSRQRNATKRRPVTPHPRAPPDLVPPSPDVRPSFFPRYAHSGLLGPPRFPPDHILIHGPDSVARMARAARLARRLLDYACHPSIARPGRTTEELDRMLRSACLERGAYPSPLNYHGFPKSVCSSINEVVCHGIPDGRPLERGDVVSFDVSCYLGGVHGDNCATIVVGDVEDGFEGTFSWDAFDDDGGKGTAPSHQNESDGTANATDQSSRPTTDWPSTHIPQRTTFDSPEEEERFLTGRRLVRAALESRDEGVAACRPGGCLSDVGDAIHAVADAYG